MRGSSYWVQAESGNGTLRGAHMVHGWQPLSCICGLKAFLDSMRLIGCRPLRLYMVLAGQSCLLRCRGGAKWLTSGRHGGLHGRPIVSELEEIKARKQGQLSLQVGPLAMGMAAVLHLP